MKRDRFTSSYAPNFQERSRCHRRGGEAHLPPETIQWEPIPVVTGFDLATAMERFNTTMTEHALRQAAKHHTNQSIRHMGTYQPGHALLEDARALLPQASRLRLYLADILAPQDCAPVLRFGVITRIDNFELMFRLASGEHMAFFDCPLEDSAETIAARALLLMD